MGEERITIVIDEAGKLHLETRGIKGPVCIDEARRLLEGVALLTQVNKTDEFYMGTKAGVRKSIGVRRE